MAIKRKLNIRILVIDQGDRLDNVSINAFLDNVVITRAAEQMEQRDGNTKFRLDNHFSKVVDVFGYAVKVEDLSLFSKVRIIHGGCRIQGQFVAFQPNNSNAVEGRTNNAATDDEEYFNYLVTGDA